MVWQREQIQKNSPVVRNAAGRKDVSRQHTPVVRVVQDARHVQISPASHLASAIRLTELGVQQFTEIACPHFACRYSRQLCPHVRELSLPFHPDEEKQLVS